MRHTSPKLVAEEKLDDKFKLAQQKLARLKANSDGLAANILDVIEGLNEFNEQNNHMNKDLQSISEDIEQTSPTDLAAMSAIAEKISKSGDDVEKMEGLAKKILAIPNVSGAEALQEALNGAKKAIEKVHKKHADKQTMGEKLVSDKEQFAAKVEDVKRNLGNFLFVAWLGHR